VKTRILLINFTPQEHEKIAAFPVEVHSGYLSDRTSIPQLKLEVQASSLYEDTAGHFRYFWENLGPLTLFVEENKYGSLGALGLPFIYLSPAQHDLTWSLALHHIEDRPLVRLFNSLKSSVCIPPKRYITNRGPGKGTYPTRWETLPIYANRTGQLLGLYRNRVLYVTGEDRPSFIILPAFKDIAAVTVDMLKTFAIIYPKLFPEIREVDWKESDKYYPQEVLLYDQRIQETRHEMETQLEQLRKEKEEAKERYSELFSLLTTSGDALKKAVLKVLKDIWELSPKDLDSEQPGKKLKEDILIPIDGSEVFAEIKGTRNKNPTAAYFTQVLTHNFLRDRENTVPALILNYDSQTKPENRSNAYTDTEEQNVFDKVIFVDTRVLYYLSIAILDHGMPIDAAKKKLFGIGRVEFDLTEYVKTKVESNPVEGSQDIAKSKQN